VEIALAAGEFEAARAAVGELEETAATYGTAALAAAAAFARGAFELAEGNSEEAAARLASAQRLWHQAENPYETARTRLLLSEAQLTRGDRDSGVLELRAACAAFERLGAQLDGELAERRLAELLA
jgi:hypothetical protein